MTKFNNKKSFDEIKSERKSQSGISFKFDGDTETVPKDTAATSGKKFENTRSFDDIKLSRAENALSMKKRILSAKRNKIANDYNNYAAEIGKRRQAYSGNGYVGTSEDDYLFAKQKKEEAERDINNLKTGYLTNPSAFSEELAWIDDIEKIYNDSAENFKKLNEFYSQFGDENTYDVYTMIPDDYQKKIDDLQAEIDVLKGNSGKSNALRYNKDESYRNSVRNAVAKMADNGELGPDSNRVKELIEKEDRLKQMQKNLDLRKYYDKTAKAYADLDFTSKDAILSAMNESNDNEVKEWLQYKYDSLLSSEELRNIANNTTDSEKRAYYNQFADDKYKKEAKEILSNSKMNGENISVFDALNNIPSLQKEYESIYSETEGGPPNPEQVKRLKELSDRISSIKKAVEDLGVDYNSVYSYFTGDSNVTGENFGGFLVNSVYSGLNQYNKGLFSSLDWLLGGTVDGFNEMFRQWTQDNFGGTGVQLPNYLHDLNDYYTRALSDNNYELNKVIDNMGGGEGWEISGKIISGTVAALPDAILAFMSAGASTVATSTASLSTKAAYATSDILGKAGITAQTMAKNPFYWTSFAREAGINYEEALQAGADNATASFTATITSLINAGIEIGVDGMSGIQGLPKNLLSGDKSAVASWVKSMISEGKEEVLQGIVQNLVAKASYDSDKDWLGIDGTAVFDLTRGLEEFGMGAAVSGILGGGPTILNSVFSRNSNVSQYDTLLENQGKRVSYMGNEILDFALKNTNLQYTSQALSRIADVNNMSYRDLGLLYLAEMVDTQVQFADSQTSEQIDTVADSFIADGEMAKYINESRSIYKQRLENNVNDYYSKQYVKSDNVSFPFKSSSDVETTTEGSFLSQNPIFNNNLSLDIQHKNNYNIFEDKATPAPATNSEHNNIVTARDNNGNPVRIYRISEINEDGSFSLKTPDGIISSEDISDGSLLKHLDFIRENGLDIAAANSYLRHMNGDSLYGEAYNRIYQSAKSGLKDFDRVKSSMPALVNLLGEKTAFAAFNLGKHAAGIDAKTQITKLDVIPQGKYSKSVSEKKTADTKTRDFLLKHIAEKSGLDIELSSLPYGENANFIANAARIVLSIESKNIIGSLFHETGEAGKAYAPKEYEDFKINLVRWWLSNKGSEYYGGKVKLYKDVYEINGVITSYQNASDELVCDAIGGLFADENGAKSLFNYLEHDNMHTIKEKVKILEKINEIFQKIIGRIKALFAGMKLNSTQKTMLEADLDIAEQLRQKYYAMLDAMREKLKTMSQDGSDRQNNDIDIRHSIETTKNGKQYVKADRQVITGNNPTVWKQQIYSYINNTIRQGKDVVVYAADGDALTITEDTAGKARFRNMIKTANGQKYRMTDSEFAAKLRAESQIDELTAVSVRGNITVPDYKNHKFAKNGFNYRTAYFMDNDGQYYKITISVGKNGNINTVYNVGKIEEAHFPLSGSKAKGVISRRGNSTSSIGNSIPQKNGSVNSQYSQNSKKNTRHQFDIDDDEIDVDEIDISALKNYTKRTYDKFGWVKVNNVLSLNEYQRFFSKLGEIKTGTKFNKDYFGNYIIPVGETPGVENVLVYTDGKFIEPNIEKVVRINSDDATKIDYYEREFIDYGRDLSKIYTVEEERGEEIFIEYTKGEYGSYGQIRAASKRSNGKTNNRNIGDDKFGGGSDTSYQLDVSEHNNGKGTEENGVRYQLDIFEETDNDEDISYNKEKGAEGNERTEERLFESGKDNQAHIEISQPQYYRRRNSRNGKMGEGKSETNRTDKGTIKRQINPGNNIELTFENSKTKRIYNFKNIPVQNASFEAQKAYNLFDKAGIETYVIDIDSYNVYENGKTKNGNFYALTACNGQVILINNNLKADFAGYKELFVHEKIHIDLKSNDPRVRERAEIFHDTVLKNIDTDSKIYQTIFYTLLKPYIDSGRSFSSLAEEFTAFISTFIAYNDGDFNIANAKMFKDPAAVLKAWHNIFDEYNLFENQSDATDAIDSGEAITYNEEKGADENGDERRTRQNRRGNSGRRAENSLYNNKRYRDLSEPSYFRGRSSEESNGISQRGKIRRILTENGRTEIIYSYPNGSYICSFKEVLPKKYSSEIKIAVRLFERTNVDCCVFANRIGVDFIEDGETENIPCYGVTVCNGRMVLLNNKLDNITGRGIFFHEMLHAGLLSEDIRILNSFEDFHDTVLKNIIPDNFVYKYTINDLRKDYDINDAEVFAEEFVALISEKIGSNDNWEYYSKMFKNPDEVRTAWAEAFKNYLPEESSGEDDVRYQLDIPEDIDNNKDIEYNKEKGADENGDERRNRQNNREYSGRKTENSLYNSKRYRDLSQSEYFRGRTNENSERFSQRAGRRGRIFSEYKANGRTEITYLYDDGYYICSFKEIPQKKYSSETKIATRLFERTNVDCYVFANRTGVDIIEDGETENIPCYGVTVCNGRMVLLNNKLDNITGRGIFFHEMLHVGLLSEDIRILNSFEDFHDTVLKNIIPDSYIYRHTIDKLRRSYDINDAEVFAEEFVALISEKIGSNDNWEYYSQMFKNPDEVRTAWAEAFKNYLPEDDDVRYQLDIPEDIDNNKDIAYNKEKGADDNEREDNRGYGSKRYEILQSRRFGRGYSESNRKNKGRYARNRTEQGQTRLTYDTGNNIFGYEFENVPGPQMSARPRRASELFTKAGIESYVFNPESAIFMSKNEEGENRNCNAVTVCGGQVILISNNLEKGISGNALFAHEAIHSYLKSESRILRERAEVLHDTILENINPLSEYYSSILNIISFSSYSKLPDIKIAEEVVAFISADIADDIKYISEENFENPQEVLKAWNRMFAEFGLPENNTDRRYQLEIPDYTDPEELKSVIHQNEKYKKLTEYLRTEVKRTYGKIVKPNYTKFVAATLKEEYNCSLPKEEIVEMLDGFYGYLSKERKSPDYSLSKTYAEEIARNILESSSDKREITDFAKTVLSDIRKLNGTLNEEQRDEVAYSYGTYGEYRRKNFGRFTVSNSGVNIEAAWDELAERYPSVFEKDANPAEMPLKLVEITDMLSDGYDSGDGLTYEDEVEALSSELIQRYIEAPRRETFADKKYDEYKDSLKKVREELKADYKERLAKVRQTSKEKTSEAMLRQKAKYEGQILRARSRKVKSEYREKIRKTVSRLTKKLTHPAEGKYVPKNLVKVTAEILSEINLDTGRGGKASEKLSQLKTVYDSLKNDPVYNVVYDEVIADMIQTLSQNVGSVSVSDMTEANLRRTYEVLKSLEHMINNAVKVRGIETEKNIFEFAKELINETSLVNKSVLTDSPIASWLNAQSRAQVMFERLAGYKKDSYWLKLYEMLNKAQLKETQIEMEGSQLFAELLRDKKQLKTLTDTKNLIDIGLKDENGNPVKITRGMMLSIRDSLRNEDNIRHITYGGYTVPVLKDYYKGNSDKAFGTGSVKVGGVSGNINVYELIKTIDENLTEYELKWLEAGRKFFDEFSKNKINEATNEMYGFEKARVSNYFPIHTSPDYLKANFESITRDMSLENSGFIKDRIKASSPLILEDYTAVINSQLKKVAKYAAMTPAVKTFNKIYGKTESGYANSVQAAINSKFGNGGKKYIENLLSDIVGSRKGEITFFDKLRGNMAQATLSLNPRVAFAQAASYPTAASEIGWKPLLKALARKDSNSIYGLSRADRELIAKYSPLLWYRSLGNSNIELGDIKEMSKTQNIVMRKMRFLMGWINAMDSATVGRLWYAAQYYVEDNFKELTPKSDAFYEKTSEVFNNIVEKTQPNYTTMQRPDILRNPNALVRQLTMFLTQRLQNMNILYDATARYKKYKRDFKGGRNGVTEDDVKTAGKKLKNAVSSQVAAAVTITIMKALCDMLLQSMYNYRDKDKEVTTESLTLGMIDSFSESVISNFLFGSELYGLISSIAFDDKYYGVSMNGVDTFTEVLENLVTTSNDLSFDNFVSLGNSVATFLGIPSKNAIKIGKGMYYWYTDITNGDAFSFKASGGTASTKSKLGKALKYSPESKDFKLQIDKILEDKETELYEKKIKEGYKEEYAKEYAEENRESSVKSSMTSLLKEEYVSASSERKAEIRKYMYKSGLYGSVDDVISTCDRWTADYEEELKKKK